MKRAQEIQRNRLCAMERQVRVRRRSLRGQRIAGSETPGASDVEDIGVALDVGWKRSIWASHLDDPDCGQVEYLLPGGPVDDDGLHAAIGTYADGKQQAAVELLRARGLGIVVVADVFDLEPPVLDVARKSIFFGARADETPLRALLIRVHVLGDLRFQAHRFKRSLPHLARRRQLPPSR